MNKHDLIKAMATEASITQDQATIALNAFLATVTKTISEGQDVKLVGFGIFSIAPRKERIGRNPKTGTAVTIPAKRIVKFKAGKDLKDAVN